MTQNLTLEKRLKHQYELLNNFCSWIRKGDYPFKIGVHRLRGLSYRDIRVSLSGVHILTDFKSLPMPQDFCFELSAGSYYPEEVPQVEFKHKGFTPSYIQ